MDDVRLVDLLPNSPFRPADWRWRLAEHLRATGRRRVPQPWHRDVSVRRIRQFQAALGRCRSDAAHLRLARREPALYAAWQIWSAGSTPITSELRARILAGQTDAEIAGLLGVTPAAVAEYEAMFFDVRSRLSAPSYVVHVVLGGRMNAEIEPGDVDALWGSVGYFHGPAMLNAVVAGCDSAYRPERFEQLAEFFRTDAQATLWRRIWLAARSLNPTDHRTQLQLLKLLPSLQEAGAATAHRRPNYEAAVHHLADSTAPVLAAAQNPAEHQVATSPVPASGSSIAAPVAIEAAVSSTTALTPPHRSGQRTATSCRRRPVLPAAVAG